MPTGIAWTDEVWNPVVGCSRVSAGCDHCYAERVAARNLTPSHRGLTKDGRWTGEVRCLPERLDQPLHWRKPRRVFVDSMSDLFHPEVPDEFIDRVFAVMALRPQHTFQVLTKRPERMRTYCDWVDICAWTPPRDMPDRIAPIVEEMGGNPRAVFWPLPNVWLGVTAENQAAADERIPHLLQTPAAVRFVSCEPLLGPVDLRHVAPWDDFHTDALDTPDPGCRVPWIIAGGESGPGARPCDVGWIRSIVEQCKAAGVACFVKQLGARPVTWPMEFPPDVTRREDAEPNDLRPLNRKGADPAEWPVDLRVQEFPEEERSA